MNDEMDIGLIMGLIQSHSGGGGGGGTDNYNSLNNLPKINGVTLKGNKSSSDLKLLTGTYSNENLTLV